MTKQETWNGVREFLRAGRYFELMSTVQAVDVQAYAADGRVLHDERGVTTGYAIDRRNLMVDAQGRLRQQDMFVRIEITTQALEAVKFIITDGISGYRASSDISDRGGRQLGTLSAAAHTNFAMVLGVGNTQIRAANANRRMLVIQNADLAESVWIRTDGVAATAAAPALKIGPGQTFAPPVPPTGVINGIRGGATDVTVTVFEAET